MRVESALDGDDLAANDPLALTVADDGTSLTVFASADELGGFAGGGGGGGGGGIGGGGLSAVGGGGVGQAGVGGDVDVAGESKARRRWIELVRVSLFGVSSLTRLI